ncbi:MAG: cupin domain-containing protein [Culicoidibacterales bacterium]
MIGTVYNTAGANTINENVKLVMKVGGAGDVIQNHNHPGYDILFTVVKGNVEVVLNNEEKHLLVPGRILHFNGENTISATFLEASEVFVTLIKQ